MITETLHCGDNLEYMKTLPSNSIDLIYSDILYGTGRDFGDYKDIKGDRKTVEAFYIPRIKEMHRLLKNTGSIYLQCDTRINHYVRLILEDIFGTKNFRNEITIEKKNIMKNKTQIRTFARNIDKLLFVTKSLKYVFNSVFNKQTSKTKERFNLTDAKGLYRLSPVEHIKKNPRFNMVYEYKGYTPIYGWHMKKEKLIEFDKKGLLQWSANGKPQRKQYFEENTPVNSVWYFETVDFNFYATQKSIELMARIIKASSNEGDVCADFFCGSGSFGVAAKKLNRNIILCDINPKAIELSKKRLQLETNLFNSTM